MKEIEACMLFCPLCRQNCFVKECMFWEDICDYMENGKIYPTGYCRILKFITKELDR